MCNHKDINKGVKQQIEESDCDNYSPLTIERLNKIMDNIYKERISQPYSLLTIKDKKLYTVYLD